MGDLDLKRSGALRFTVCIPTVRPATLTDAIESILQQTHQNWELIVVGQGDVDVLRATAIAAARSDSRVRFLHLDRKGLSRARNAAIAAATGDVVAFIDDDCQADSGWLAALAGAFDDDIGFVCGAVVAPDGPRPRFSICPAVTPAETVFDPVVTSEPPNGFIALGANMAVRRSDTLRVGGFDEFLGAGATFQGGEEHDYVARLARAGVRMRSTPRAVVHHTYGVRTGLGAMYRHKRERVRGDGAFFAKHTIAMAPEGGRKVRDCTTELLGVLVRQVPRTRLPLSAFRIYHFAASYRECLRGFGLSTADASRAVLVPRPAGDRVAVTGGAGGSDVVGASV